MGTKITSLFVDGILVMALCWAQLSAAQAASPAAVSAPMVAPTATRTPAPDGAPVLAKDDLIDQSTSGREDKASAIVAASEEKIENRLAVIRSGGYVVTDPTVGRYDRAASNGVKRVAPSMWELLRF